MEFVTELQSRRLSSVGMVCHKMGSSASHGESRKTRLRGSCHHTDRRTRRKEIMKSQDTVMDVEGTSKAASRIVFLSDIEEEERRRTVPTSEEIRQRAFEIYIERGRIHGSDLGDWMQAERELQEKIQGDRKSSKKK